MAYTATETKAKKKDTRTKTASMDDVELLDPGKAFEDAISKGLSKPEDYKGCELQLFNGESEPEELPIKKQGSLIMFKADEWHRVTKLTECARYSLVMWITGPQLT